MLIIPNPSRPIFIGYFNYNSQKGEYQTEVINDKNEKIFKQYEQVLPLMFKDASTDIPYEKSVLMYKENDKYGIIDFNGKKITKPIYDEIESMLYKEGCLLVKQADKYGVITMKGKKIAQVKYDSISADGYYDEETKYQKAGFVIGQKKEEGYRYGYINSNGYEILEVEYNEIDRVTEIIDSDDVYLLAFKTGQAGIYQNKKEIIKHEYQEIEYNKKNQLFIVEKNDKQGVVDREGKQILDAEYDYIIVSSQTISAEKEGSMYYFDINGNEKQLTNKLTFISTENNNYLITINEKEQFGVINKEGNTILENEYSYIEYAFKDYFIVSKENKVGVIDASKNNRIAFEYNVIQKVESANILQAIKENQTTTIDIYNENIEKVASMEKANLVVEKDYIKLYSNKDRKYFNKSGNEVENKEIFNNSSLFAFSQDEKWGFKDKEGIIKVEPIYDMVTELNTYGFGGIKKDNKWGVINSEGQVIVEPSYEIEFDEPEFIGPYCKLNFGYGIVYYTKDLKHNL